MADIAVKIESGEAVSLPRATTVAVALEALLSGKQRKKTLAAYVNGALADLDTELSSDAVIVPIQKDSNEALEILRHSTSHIMAQAVGTCLVPMSKSPSARPSKTDFITIFCARPRSALKISKNRKAHGRNRRGRPALLAQDIDRLEAIEMFKAHWAKNTKSNCSRKSKTTGLDLPAGRLPRSLPRTAPPDTSWVKDFKLLRVAGAYWRGDENKRCAAAHLRHRLFR
jgi:threonyl-tRNA synthetase